MNYFTYLDSPIGPLLLTSDGEALTGLFMNEHAQALAVLTDAIQTDDLPILVQAKQQIAAYFAGSRTSFDLPLRPTGTAFQEKVWKALESIPFGETISYGELARRIGNPNASRAVGLANGRNPISIIVPCHRVIGADKSLTGYGGGLPRKKALLEHETKVIHKSPQGTNLSLEI